MLQFINMPQYFYYAYSMNQNEDIIGLLCVNSPTKNEDRYVLTFSMPHEQISIEDKAILANDIIDFMTLAQKSIKKADS